MSQTDIVFTKNNKIMGYIWKNVLLKYSILIDTSIKNINNFDNKLIKTIDISDICKDPLYCSDYIFEKKQIDWEYVFDIINSQTVFLGLWSPKYFTDKILNNLLYVRSIANYLVMDKLSHHCNEILSLYTKNDDRVFLFAEARCITQGCWGQEYDNSNKIYANFITKKSLQNIKKYFKHGHLPLKQMSGKIYSPPVLCDDFKNHFYSRAVPRMILVNTMCILNYYGGINPHNNNFKIHIYICKTPTKKLLQYIYDSNKYVSMGYILDLDYYDGAESYYYSDSDYDTCCDEYDPKKHSIKSHSINKFIKLITPINCDFFDNLVTNKNLLRFFELPDY